MPFEHYMHLGLGLATPTVKPHFGQINQVLLGPCSTTTFHANLFRTFRDSLLKNKQTHTDGMG